jgi:hypothetical protein
VRSDRDEAPELQVKSVERVRDLGEVFTSAAIVWDMLDLLPSEIWTVHPSPTFLEPACGDGNFLVAILDRKLSAIAAAEAHGRLPAGSGKDALQYHALEALASIYAVDISIDNVIGGMPGHELGARDRLVSTLRYWYTSSTGGRLTERSPFLLAAHWVVERNVQIGNMLPSNSDGTPSGRERLPLVEYRWSPDAMSVSLLTTTLGAVTDEAAGETSGSMTLFGPPEPDEVWSGKALCMYEAPINAPITSVTHTRNGKGGL